VNSFLTAPSRNILTYLLTYLSVSSKGSTKLNQETGTKRHLSAVSASKMRLQSELCLKHSSDLLAGEEGLTLPSQRTPSHCRPSASNFSPQRQIYGYRTATGSICNQNCYKGYCLKEKVEKHCFRVPRALHVTEV